MSNMLKWLRFAGLWLITLLFSFSLQAQYCPTYAGGEFTYKAIGGNKYEIKLILYRNCSSCASLGSTQSVTCPPNNCKTSYTYLTFKRSGSCVDVTPITPGCSDSSVCKGGSLPGTQRCVYIDTVALSCADSNWQFYYTGYYRDTTTNVSGSYNYFSTYCVINNFNYTSQNTVSTAPTISDDNDVYYVCPGHEASFSLGGYDSDGDSLGYSVVTPYSYYSPYYKTYISYNSGFAATSPIDASCFGIDSTSGQVTYRPTTNESSLMAVVITKYRRINGTLHVVGVIYRNIEIRVLSTTQCNGNKTPVMFRPKSISGGTYSAVSNGCDSGYYFSVCPGHNLSFTLPCLDSNSSQTLTATTNASSVFPGSTSSIVNGSSGVNSKNITISWTPAYKNVGTYSLIVTLHDNNCPYQAWRSYTVFVTVLQPTYAGVDTTICKGQSVTLTAAGGTTFSWTSSSSSTPTTGSTLSVSPTVTTSYYLSSNLTGSCKSKDTVVVFVSPSFKLSMSPSLDSVCLNQVKNVTVSTNTAGTYSYYWYSNDRFKTTPSTTDSSVGAWPLANNWYHVRVVKSGGCTEVDSAYIKISGVAPAVKASVLPRRILCTGDSVQLNAFTPVSSSSYCNPTPSSYGCTYYGAIDSAILGSTTFFKGVGCYGTYLNYGLLNSTCFNAGSSYKLTLGTVSGTYGMANYGVWIDFNHNGVFDYNEFVFGTVNTYGTYVHSKTITIPASAVPGRTRMRIMASPGYSSSYAFDSTMSCGNPFYYGEIKDLDIMVCSSGISYSWSPSSSVTNSTIMNPKAFPTTTTTYTVTATMGSSCSNSDTVSVTVVPTFTLTASPHTDTICYLKSVSLSASTSPSSIPTSISWLLGSQNGPTVATGSSYSVTPIHSYKYIAEAVSTAGCTKFDSVNVIVLPSPTLTATAIPDTICLGDSVKLSAFSVSSSSCSYCNARPLYPQYCYSSYLLDSLNFGSLSYADGGCGSLTNGYLHVTSPVPSYSLGSTYTLTARPNTGASYTHLAVWIDYNHNCSFEDAGELIYTSPASVSSPVSASVSIPLSAIPGKTRMRVVYFYYYSSSYAPLDSTDACDSSGTSGSSYSYGEVVDFDVNLFAPSVYTWSPTTTPAHGAVVSAAPTTTTIYTVSYKNGGSCTGRDSVKVYVVPNFTVSATPQHDTICYGHNDTLRASVVISGSPFTINWLTGSRSGSVLSTHGVVPLSLPSRDSKYILQVHARSGCTKYDSAFIHVAPSPLLNPTAVPDTICLGDSVKLSAFASSSSSCTYCNARPGYSGCYSSYLLDSIHFGNLSYVDSGCSKLTNGYKHVTNPTPTFNIGSSYTLNIVPNPYGYQMHLAVWIDYNKDCSFTSDTSELLYSSNAAVSGSLTIPINIPVNAIPGKTRMRVMYMYYYNYPYVPLELADACDSGTTIYGTTTYYGEVVDFDINLFAPISYTWSPSTNPVHSANVKAAPTTTTTYTVSYKNGTSCSGSASIAVTVVPNFTATVTPHNDTLCYGHIDTLKLAVNPTSTIYTASWYLGSSLTGTYLGTGSKYHAMPSVAHAKYICKVASTSGCTKYDSSIITVLPSPILSPMAIRDTICKGDSVSLSAFSSSSSSCKYCSAATTYCYSFYAADSIYLGGSGYATPCSTSGTTGYLHFTTPVPVLNIGNTYTLKVKMTSTYNLAVWVDFNHNCSFLDTMELVYNTTSAISGMNNITFTVPLGALPGNTRMRIFTGYYYSGISQYDACDSSLSSMYGQFVDLDINLYAPIVYTWSPATNPVHAANVKAAPTATTTYTVSFKNGGSCNSSATVQVVVSPNYTTTITPRYDSLCYGTTKSISATSSPSGASIKWYATDTTTGVISTGSPFLASPTVARQRYIALFDLNGCYKEDSSILKVLPAPVLSTSVTPRTICLGDSTLLGAFAVTSPTCFCAAYATNGCGGYYVDSFLLASTTMIGKSACNTGTNGYQLYSTPVFTANLGTSYTFHLVLNNTYSYFGVWIDFDHSCSFDPGELVYSNTATGNNTYTFTVPIPMSAVPGLTRIRIRSGYCSTCYGGSGLPANYGCDITGMYNGETDDFMLNITTSGLSYSWAPSTAGVAHATLATTKAAPTTSTTYTVSFSSSGVCTGSDTVSVNVVPNFTITATPSSDSFCTAGTIHTASSSSQTISVSLAPSGSGPFSIKWYLDDTATAPIDTTNLSYSAPTSKSGKYYMKVTSGGGSGCVKLDSSVISVLPFVNVGATASPNILCPYNYTSLNSFALGSTVSYCPAKTQYGCDYYSTYYKYYYAIDSFYFAGIIKNPGGGKCNGGSTGYKYMGAYTGTCLNAGNTYGIAFGVAGAYSIYGYRYNVSNYAAWIDYNHDGIFDATECIGVYNNTSSPYTLKGTVTIPTYTLPGNTRLRVRSAQGGYYGSALTSSMGCDTASVTYGTVQDYDICIDNSYLNYSWSPSAGVDTSTAPATMALVTATTTYTVTLSGYGGYCKSSDTASVKTPSVTLEAGPDTTVCAGKSITLNGSYSGSGTVKWSTVNPGDSITIASPTSAVTSVTPTSTTQYILTASFTYGSFSCSLSDTVTVLYDNPSPFTLTADTTTICPGKCIHLTAPSGYSKVLWSSTSYTFTQPDSIHQKICATTSAEIKLTLADNHGCGYTDSFMLTVSPSIWPTAHSDTSICPGGIATLNGGAGSAWLWTPSTGLSGLSSRIVQASPSTATTYTLTVTDVNGCKHDTTLKVSLYPGVTAYITPDTIIVYGSAGHLHASGGATYYWTPNVAISSPYAQSPVVSPTQTTTYHVLVTDSNTCTATASVVVTVTSPCLGMHMASAFSPDGDGSNDYAAIQGWGYDELIDCRIFNRWGQLVFQTTNKNEQWDGTYNGIQAEMGTYIYIIKSKCQNDVTVTKGNITLIR